ncbi:MAG TPA: TonB-dependent receptor [Thermoanaerobaculia bacterium]|nr:TonB-dependent receptor [Thermoanaerobaculia bacterium]
MLTRKWLWMGMGLLVWMLPVVPVAAQDEPQPAPEEAQSQEEDQEPQEEQLQIFDKIEVTGRESDLLGIADSAGEGVTGREDLERRPLLRPGELLETVPGVIITQHSGGGKANQYFVRGFNLDHGTDFRITVDGIQVNMPTHGHGQGYSDLNFLIPELVESVRYKKGAYSADEGDFSSAGAAEIRYLDALPQGLIHVSPGELGYGRVLVADSTALRGGNLLGALEYSQNDGPWQRPDDFRKVNGLVRWSQGDAARGFTFTAMGYDGTWDSTDQIPRRAMADGRLDRFGLVDPTDGGSSSRYSLAAERRFGGERSLTRLAAYYLRYDLELFSNFTYALDDPENGDQFEQLDERDVLGFTAERQWVAQGLGGRSLELAAGLQARVDDIHNGLFHTRERVRLGTTREDQILLWNGGPYVQGRVRWTPWLRTVAGLRGDFFHADVDSDLRLNSGEEDDFLLSPKLSVLLGPWRETELYLNLGYGFHSNDARGATITVDPRTGEPLQRVDPLVRAKSADFGVRTEVVPELQLAATVFSLELDSELVFIGDAGGTEASRPSRRTGIEIQSFYRPLPWLTFDADLALSRGRFTDDDPAGDRIPGAIERALAAGVSVEDLGNLFGSLRLRHFGPRPLIEDDSVRSDSSILVNARLGYELASGLRLAAEVFNLFDEEANDIEYFYESRLPGEADPVEDVHFHPAEPRAFRLVAEWSFGG